MRLVGTEDDEDRDARAQRLAAEVDRVFEDAVRRSAEYAERFYALPDAPAIARAEGGA